MAAGKFLAEEFEKNREYQFSVSLPGEYTLRDNSGPLEGVLNGRKYAGESQYFEIGVYVFRSNRRAVKPVIIWSPALENGFSPYGVKG